MEPWWCAGSPDPAPLRRLARRAFLSTMLAVAAEQWLTDPHGAGWLVPLAAALAAGAAPLAAGLAARFGDALGGPAADRPRIWVDAQADLRLHPFAPADGSPAGGCRIVRACRIGPLIFLVLLPICRDGMFGRPLARPLLVSVSRREAGPQAWAAVARAVVRERRGRGAVIPALDSLQDGRSRAA